MTFKKTLSKLLLGLLMVAALLLGAGKSSQAQVVPAAVGPGAYVAVGAGVSGFQAVRSERENLRRSRTKGHG
jgi:opacity protein-like surface antigen